MNGPFVLHQLYRLFMRIPMSYVTAVRSAHGTLGQKVLLENVKDRLGTFGFNDTKLVTQDPTDNTRFSAITRYTRPERRVSLVSGTNEPYIQILRAEPVEEPPPPMKGEESPRDPRLLDPGLSPDEAATIKYALLSERNARHLGGIAETLCPWFPVSASLLRVKSLLIEARVPMTEDVSARLIKEAHTESPPNPQLSSRISGLERYTTRSAWPREVVKDEVKRAASSFAGEPSEPLPNVPREIQDLARCLVREISFQDPKNKKHFPNGLWIVDPQKIREVFPSDGSEGFVSPSALQLALAICKPEWSGISGRTERIVSAYDRFDEKQLQRRMSPMERVDMLKARNQMERAKRSLERRRWIEWYRRTQHSQEASR